MSLSDKIWSYDHIYGEQLNIDDVKEFIKELKDHLIEFIDQLVGDKLI